MKSQAMRRNAVSRGFTLVELIVVITILAILGTIGFMSFQGYTADARNTKRTNDVNSISSALTVKRASTAMAVVDFVSWTDNNLTAGNIAGIAIASIPATSYAAGKANYAVLSLKPDDFKDPSGNEEYRIGASSSRGGLHEVSATIESGDGKQAIVKGDYSPRTSTDINATWAGSGKVNGITAADGTKFANGDTVTLSTFTAGNGTYKIKKISLDGKYVEFDTTTAITGAGKFKLAVGDEADGLVGDKTDKTKAVVDRGNTYLPY